MAAAAEIAGGARIPLQIQCFAEDIVTFFTTTPKLRRGKVKEVERAKNVNNSDAQMYYTSDFSPRRRLVQFYLAQHTN